MPPVGNQPASIAGIYASEIISTFDIDKPERLNVLFRARGDQGMGYFRMMESLGFKMPVAQDKFEHDEEDWIHETFNSRDNEAAPGPGNIIQITLDPVNLDSGNRFYPRVGDTVMFPDNEVTGTILAIDVTTPTAPVLDISPNEITDDIGAVSAGQELIIISAAFSEGSDQPEGTVSGTFHYDNDMQIIKETLAATGSEMTNQKWFTQLSMPTSGGGFIPAYYLKGQMDTDYRMNLKIDGALLFQKRTTNTNIDPNTNRQVKTTEGLIPYIRRVGNIINYTPGLFSVQRFNQIVKRLDKEWAPKYICSLLGIDLDIEVEDTLVDYFKDTNINYVQKDMATNLFYGNEGLAASVGFRSFIKGSRTFGFKKMPIFSHAKLYGAPGYKTAGLGVFLPMTKKKNKLTDKDLPTFGVRYKKLGPYNRMMEVWNVSGAGPFPKVISTDLHQHFLRTHVGAHHMAGNQMVLVDPSA